MRLTITLIISLLYSFTGLAQSGSYFLAQYNLKEQRLSNYNYDIVQDNRGLIYMANLKGVIVSDGLDWSLIETPYSVFSLVFDQENNLYVGGRKEIAVINQASNLPDKYHTISKINQEILEIKHHNNSIYFLTENTLYIYAISTKTLNTINKPSTDAFLDISISNGSILITSTQKGIQELKEGKLQAVTIDFPEGTLGVKTSSNGNQLAYTSLGKYFIKKQNQASFTEFIMDDKGYLNEHIPVNINWVNNNLLAISTINGGVVFISTSTGKVDQYMNYENGLADNEVIALFVSRNNVVWCSTPQGISIIAPETPIKNYTSYKGLSGKINVVYNYKNRVFVGTSVGLFELVKKAVFKDIISYNKVTRTEEIEGEVVQKKKKGLFKKKKKTKTPVTIVREKTYYKKQVKQLLLSQSYEYQKIDKVDFKVVQLVEYNGKLLIGTLGGIYELENSTIKKIYNEPIVYMYAPNNASFLIISTYRKEVKVLTERNNSWHETGLLDGLDGLIEQIKQGKNNSLWLCGTDSLYRIELSNAYTLDDVEVYAINNPHWERIYANLYKGKNYFLNSSGYYYYDNYAIRKDTLLENTIGLPAKILTTGDNLWVNTGHSWYGGGKDLNNTLNFISLFKDPSYLSDAGNNQFWVVVGNNNLYKIDGNAINSISRKFNLFLERVEKDSVELPITKHLGDINQQSSLSFKFSSPDFTNIYKTEFQYRLVGLSKDWSEWSKTNNQIVFPYLPAGSYSLEVKARDALGNAKNSESISFNILAPYWKRSWFYLMELIFFGGLMTISVLINRNKQKFTILSRLLTFLTLIFIVEFVQTVAEAKFETNHSPVINFFIQVAIALSILPVEGILRKFITAKERKKVEAEKALIGKKKKES